MTADSKTRIQLRSYQLDIAQQIFSHWSNGYSSVAVQLPTGAGKTIIFTAVANEFISRTDPVLVIAHRTELITQAAAKLETVTNHSIGIIKAGIKPNPDSLIQVASIHTLVRRNPPPASLVIFDEAHHCHSKNLCHRLSALQRKRCLHIRLYCHPRPELTVGACAIFIVAHLDLRC